MKKYGNEFMVGLFIILCVLGFFYLIYSTGKLDFKKEGYYIYVIFDDISGVQKKAPVMLNGMEIGKVDEVKFVYDNDKTQIRLKLWLKAEARIRENPVISIKTMGLMGEKFIQISSSRGVNFIAPEVVLSGNPYLDIDSLTKDVSALTEEVKKLAAGLNDTLDGNKDKISQIVVNLESTSKNFQEFSDDIKQHPWKLLFKGKETKAK
jgi:phospholipid/cholesterol/gamma-HCH transport system substrate-binding protein